MKKSERYFEIFNILLLNTGYFDYCHKIIHDYIESDNDLQIRLAVY